MPQRQREQVSDHGRSLIGGPKPGAVIEDGRQSDRALAIRRGTCRLLRARGLSPAVEVPLPDGHRADVVGLSARGEIWIVEIKSSLADFRTDQKWPAYRDWSDRFYFAVSDDFPREILPAEAGLIIADRYGGEVMREPAESKLSGARRKALTIRLAQLSTDRILSLLDPELSIDDATWR